MPHTTEAEISQLFDRWNASLQSGEPEQVAKNYAERSILLPTLSNTPRLTEAEKIAYFVDFLANKPSGEIDERQITIDENLAIDSGIYTFTFGTTGQKVQARYSFAYQWNGEQWLIVSHHSSGMPEAA